MSGMAIAILLSSLSLPARSHSHNSLEGTPASLIALEASPSLATARLARLETARQIVDRRIEALEPSDKTPWQPIYDLAKLARAYSEAGEHTQAVDLLNRAVEFAEQYSVDDGYDYPKALVQIAPYYDSIGETAAADELLKQAIEVALTSDSTGTMLGFVAEAYAKLGDKQVTEKGLLNIVELVTDPNSPAYNSLRGYSFGRFLEAYLQIENDAAAREGLSKLLSSRIALLEASENEDHPNTLSFQTLSQFATAFGKHNDPETAKNLLAQVMERLRSNQEDERKNLYRIGIITSAYGYLGDTVAAEQGLSELMEMFRSINTFPQLDNPTKEQQLQAIYTNLYDDSAPLSTIAAAYGRIGNIEKAQEILGAYRDRLRQIENSGNVLLFGPVVQAYEEIGDVAGQEDVLQQMFNEVPALKEGASQGVNIADVTPGYMGITTLLDGYIATPDDAIAQERLKVLEDFFRDIRYDEHAFSGQLTDLAAAALARGDEENAHRLMLDAMQLVGTPEDQFIPDDPRFNALKKGEDFEKSQQRHVLGSIARNYGQIKDEQMRAVGLEALELAATRIDDAKFRADVERAITLSYAGI